MDKKEVYKSIGHIEAYFRTNMSEFNDSYYQYIHTHIATIIEYVDNSFVKSTEKNDYCKIIKSHHVFYDGKCDYCGKVKDDN